MPWPRRAALKLKRIWEIGDAGDGGDAIALDGGLAFLMARFTGRLF
jgi:hypothetical protein